MSDSTLLLFGCVVSFIAAAGAYVYLRECFTKQGRPRKPEARPKEVVPENLRDVA